MIARVATGLARSSVGVGSRSGHGANAPQPNIALIKACAGGARVFHRPPTGALVY